jgi:phosphoglucomutase
MPQKPDPVFTAQFAHRFNTLNRALFIADKPETWQPAIAEMDAFLDECTIWLQADPKCFGQDTVAASRMLSLLLTVAATGTQGRLELYQPKDGKQDAQRKAIDEDYLPSSNAMRRKAINLAKVLLAMPCFAPLKDAIKTEIFPLLSSLDAKVDPDRYMPYRIIQIGNIYENLYRMRLRTADPLLAGTRDQNGLLRQIFDRKYLRFGTSGVRARWEEDFTESRARQVLQAICDFMNARNVPDFVGAEDLSGKIVVLGHDTRRNSDLATEWAAETCLANGFQVHMVTRDVPTPALAFYETEVLPANEVAGLIIATASHNPPEWQGIKFNPRLGYPAPTNVTDYMAFRINELQLVDQGGAAVPLEAARRRGLVHGFDPLDAYVKWIMANGKDNARIPLDFDRIRQFFADKLVVVDEMHGAGRGYLTRLMGEAGIRYTVLHAQVDPDLGGQDYANPEEPFNELLKETVRKTGAQVGMGMDTDADRFGIVDKGGVYFRPNQILPMLLYYLGVERKLTGRVIATQTGSPLIEPIAGMIPNNEANYPAEGVLPGYIGQRIYKPCVGDIASRVLKYAFSVPVGIKYIEEIRRMDASYKTLKELPEDWRDRILIGGEESSGLTTRGHITDKDGPWANILILDMLAYYGTRKENPLTSLQAIWEELVAKPGLWESFGTATDPSSRAGRADVDAPLEAKEAFINHYLDLGKDGKPVAISGLNVEYLGGIRYELVEMQLSDPQGNDRHFLRMRASGTEPINRIYIESSDPQTGQRMMRDALEQLEEITRDVLKRAHSEWQLVEMLANTTPTPMLLKTVQDLLSRKNWDAESVRERMQLMLTALEKRNRKVLGTWLEAL